MTRQGDPSPPAYKYGEAEENRGWGRKNKEEKRNGRIKERFF
jgi:hypothetical protein